MNDERLSRMETKLDKLSEAVVAMARMGVLSDKLDGFAVDPYFW